MTEPLLRMSLIGKRFPGVQALDDAGLEVLPGEIHALLGENGAGKSTLIKILSGAQQPDSGTIEFGGQRITVTSPHDAQRRGIVTIYQEFTLAPNMTIAENVFIGREPGFGVFVSWGKMAAETRAITARLGLQLRPMSIVRELRVAEQQMVEIARALSMKSRLIVMDEPTSALSTTEVEKLFRIVRDLKAQGLSIIFVTHRLEEVMQICDRYTVLRDGRLIGSGSIADATIDGIIRLIVGRQVNALFARRERATVGDVVLSVEGLTRRGNAQDQNAIVLADVGLVGYPNAGKSTLISRISAAKPKIADYPFTTLEPNLGVVTVGEEPHQESFVVADVPGLIEGAHLGSGLGVQFLRHIERTRVLAHLVDVSDASGRPDPVEDFKVINNELASFGNGLDEKPMIVVATKIDAANPEKLKKLSAHAKRRKLEFHAISAVTGQGIDELKWALAKHVRQPELAAD